MARQAEIVDALQDHGFQSVRDLADRFEVTQSTIRRDLERLETMDLIKRTHGGAMPVQQSETPHQFKEELHRAEKAAIGRAMAERVLENQTILLAGGTTTLEVARHLDHQRLTVVTNDVRIASVIARKPSLHLVMVGGELLPNTHTLWGPTSMQQLANLRVDVAIFGTDTVGDDGLYSATSYEIELKRQMRSIAKEAFFVADSSKFGREALFKVFGMEDLTAGITDDHLDPLRASHYPVPLIQASVDS
jgi:DeoR/GlpR family transcriptional regulator of sugar metabolism